MKYLTILVELAKATNGGKTYLAAAGMACLGFYYVLHGDDPIYGVKVILEALAVFGIGNKIARTPDETVKVMDATPAAPPIPKG